MVRELQLQDGVQRAAALHIDEAQRRRASLQLQLAPRRLTHLYPTRELHLQLRVAGDHRHQAHQLLLEHFGDALGLVDVVILAAAAPRDACQQLLVVVGTEAQRSDVEAELFGAPPRLQSSRSP